MVSNITKICIVSGTRAEYGLLKILIDLIHKSENFELQLVPTCMHLSPEYGSTLNEILDDKYPIKRSLDMLLSSNTSVGISKSFGLGVIGFADILDDLKPDILILLGDRFESLSAACAALFAKVPLAHIHGGEITEGCFDDNIRHSITKMSHIHFVASDIYAKRVMQLGESPNNIYNVGGLGVDAIMNMKFINKSELEEIIGFKFLKNNLLITFHPVTLEEDSIFQFKELIKSLNKLKDVGMIFTMPNADNDSRKINIMIKDFCNKKNNACYFNSLGSLKYLSCMKLVDAVVGNTSSGILEAPSLKIGTIDIGERQKGRLKASSVIECKPSEKSIDLAFKKIFSLDFKKVLENTSNPYGTGGASQKIFDILSKLDLDKLVKKEFFDLTNSIKSSYFK